MKERMDISKVNKIYSILNNEKEKNIELFGMEIIPKPIIIYSVKQELTNGYVEIEIEGLTYTGIDNEIIDSIKQLNMEGFYKIIFNLYKLRIGRGMLIGTLIYCARLCNKNNGNFIVKGIDENHQIYEVFKKMGFSSEIHFSSNIEDDITNNVGFLKNIKNNN
jgi:hypothetical protein